MSPTDMRRIAFYIVCITAISIAPALQAQFVDPAQKSRFEAIDRALEQSSPEQRVAFNALLVAFTTFRDAHVTHEVCSGKDGCRTTLPQETEKLNTDFLNIAEGTLTRGLPALTADGLIVADATLNRFFEKTLAALPQSCGGDPDGCLSQATFRETQRDWIRYRDAALTFTTLRWPQLSPDSVKTLITLDRTAQIMIQLPKP